MSKARALQDLLAALIKLDPALHNFDHQKMAEAMGGARYSVAAALAELGNQEPLRALRLELSQELSA